MEPQVRYSLEAALILLALINPLSSSVVEAVTGTSGWGTSIVITIIYFAVVLLRMYAAKDRTAQTASQAVKKYPED